MNVEPFVGYCISPQSLPTLKSYIVFAVRFSRVTGDVVTSTEVHSFTLVGLYSTTVASPFQLTCAVVEVILLIATLLGRVQATFLICRLSRERP